jgi:hypothetical protein
MFDPELNLLAVARTWKHQSWIHPLTEPLREEPWNVPSREWAGVLGVKLPVEAIPREPTGNVRAGPDPVPQGQPPQRSRP